eukprot:15365187-Ditylum_brightwellii.AAC.1
MHHVTDIRDKYKASFHNEEKESYSAFPPPLVLNTYMVPPTYAKSLVSDVEIMNNLTLYDKPPNVWARGPPNGTSANSMSPQKTQQIIVISTRLQETYLNILMTMQKFNIYKTNYKQ